MAPYNPPRNRAWYTELRLDDRVTQLIISKMIGIKGYGFYDLTSYLKIQYLWYNRERHVIELWGDKNVGSARDKLIDVVDSYVEAYS